MIDDLQERFEGVKETGASKWQCKCPAHEDNKASLSICRTDSKWLLYCHAGCKTKAILDAVGVDYKSLFADERPNTPAIVYEYHKADGSLAFRVHRFAGKEFRQQAPNGDWSLKGIERVPYRLPEVIAATRVFVVEGEKDVETLRAWGLVATCNNGGAEKWQASFAQYFAGKQVCIIPDNDEAGERHATMVLANLSAVASCKVLRLPVGEKGDVTDWVAMGGTKEAFDELVCPKPKVKQQVKMPTDCLAVQGLLKEVIDYNLATALYPQPELALAAAIAFCGAVFGRRVAAKFGTRTNFYCLGIAPTGAGKEHARKINKKLAIASGKPKLLGSERLGSASGLINQTAARPSVLFQLDEMGRMLQTMNNPRIAPHLYNIGTVLSQFFTSSDTYWESDALADENKVKTIQQPNCCVYGTSTPDQFWDSVTYSALEDGLLGRMLVFEAQGYVDEQSPEDLEPPTSLVESLRAWFEFCPVDQAAGNMTGTVVPKPPVIPFTEKAEARIVEHRRAIATRRKSDNKESSAVWSRTNEKASKLSLLSAASRCGPIVEAIELRDVEWGIRVANYCSRLMVDRVDGHVSTNEVESSIKRLLRVIREAGQEGISGTVLSKRTQWLKARDRNEMLSHLQTTEQISVEISDSKTKPGYKYVSI